MAICLFVLSKITKGIYDFKWQVELIKAINRAYVGFKWAFMVLLQTINSACKSCKSLAIETVYGLAL